MIEYGLKPVKALLACEHPCHQSSFYRYLENILDKIRDERVKRIVEDYHNDVVNSAKNKKIIEYNNSPRRQLFPSPDSSINKTSMMKNVTLNNNIDKCILSPLTDDSFIEYNFKLYSNNSTYAKKDSWWTKRLKRSFEMAEIISSQHIFDLEEQNKLKSTSTTYSSRKSVKQVNMMNKCAIVKTLIYDAQYKDVLKNTSADLKHNKERRIWVMVYLQILHL